MISAAIAFWREHLVLVNLSNAALGFGLVIVLQRYVRGEPFLPVAVGWIVFGLGLFAHLYAFTLWQDHLILANLTHATLGFGLAIVLQRYVRGKPFLPVAVGWILLGIGVLAHLYVLTR